MKVEYRNLCRRVESVQGRREVRGINQMTALKREALAGREEWAAVRRKRITQAGQQGTSRCSGLGGKQSSPNRKQAKRVQPHELLKPRGASKARAKRQHRRCRERSTEAQAKTGDARVRGYGAQGATVERRRVSS